MSTKIARVRARQIIDSRGNPTVEGRRFIWNPARLGAQPCPLGASTGEHEALELRDGDKSKYLGKGVLKRCTTRTRKLPRRVAVRTRRTSGRWITR